jgi:hypothetical protein
MDDIQQQIDDINSRLDDNDSSLQDFSDNLDNNLEDINGSIDDINNNVDELQTNEGQLLFPLSQDTIDLINEQTNLFMGVYGDMYAYNATITITVSASNTFYQIGTGLSGGLCVGFTFQNARELLCGVEGTYRVVWSMSVHSASNNQECEGSVMLNGTGQSFMANHSEIINSGKPTSISGSGIIFLSVGDLISLCVANHTGATNLIIDHVTLTISKLGN